MKKSIVAICASGLLWGGLVSTAGADTVWGQPPLDWGKILSSVSFNSWSADDFKLASTTTIDSVAWWGGRGGETPVVDGFYIRFYSDYYDADYGLHYADQLLYEEYITGDAGQTMYNGETYAYSTLIGGTFTAQANRRYWLSVQADTRNDPNDVWWGWQKSSTSNLSEAEYNSSSSSHKPMGTDLAFALGGSPVPLPATAWLFGSGLLGLMALSRRRRS